MYISQSYHFQLCHTIVRASLVFHTLGNIVYTEIHYFWTTPIQLHVQENHSEGSNIHSRIFTGTVLVTRKSVDEPWGFTTDSYGRVNKVTDLSLEAKGIIAQCCASYSYNQITAVDGTEVRDMKNFHGHSQFKKCIDDAMKDKTSCTLKFGYWDYFIPAKCNWSDKKMPLGFKLDFKTFRIVDVNSFGKFDGFKVGMRVTGLHFYYYKLAGSYKVLGDKRMQQFTARLNQLKSCRYVAVSVEAS